MNALIYCAGLGERLRPITKTIAKPAVPFLNIPMLGFPLFWLETLGLEKVTVNTHYLPETVRAAAEKVRGSYPLYFSHEPEILGSGGGMREAEADLSGRGNFVTANGDAVFFMKKKSALKDMLNFHVKSKALATLLVCPYPGVGERIPGVWVDTHNQVCSFGKNQGSATTCYHYSGVAIFSDRVFSMLPAGSSNILYDVLKPAIERGDQVGAWVEPLRWYETGSPREYLHATRECLTSLFDGTALEWNMTDILDRFSGGWRNHQEKRLLAAEPVSFEHFCLEKTRVLLAPGVHSETSVQFEGLSVIGEGLDLSGRTATDGVYIPEAHMWVR